MEEMLTYLRADTFATATHFCFPFSLMRLFGKDLKWVCQQDGRVSESVRALCDDDCAEFKASLGVCISGSCTRENEEKQKKRRQFLQRVFICRHTFFWGRWTRNPLDTDFFSSLRFYSFFVWEPVNLVQPVHKK